MKICLVNPTTILRRPIGELAHALAEHGHHVTLAWSQVKGGGWGEGHFDRLTNHPRIYILPIWSREVRSLFWPIPRDTDLASKVKGILEEHDIVHLWAPFYLFPYRLLKAAAARKRRAKVVVSFDTIPSYSFRFGLSGFGTFLDYAMRWYFKRWLGPLLRRIDSIALYSPLLRPYFLQAVPAMNTEKIEVLPTGTLFSEKKEEKGGAHHRKSFKVLFIGLLNERKGIDTVIKVASKVANEFREVCFVIAGTSSQQEKWEKQAAELVKAGNVRFMGRTQKVDELYKEADLFFLPSRAEGLPGVIMEAMTYGLPVVSSNIPCLSDLITQGVNGMLCDPENADEFARAIVDLLGDEKKRQAMGAANRLKIKEFSWDKMYPRYKAHYQALLKR